MMQMINIKHVIHVFKNLILSFYKGCGLCLNLLLFKYVIKFLALTVCF